MKFRLICIVMLSLAVNTACQTNRPMRTSSQYQLNGASLSPLPKQDPRAILVKVPASVKPEKTQTSNAHGDVLYLTELSDVEEEGDFILVGKPIQQFVNERSHFVRYHQRGTFDNDPNEYPEEEWTMGSFLVTEVLSQPPGNTVTAGQTIWVSEPVGFSDYNGAGFFKTIVENCEELKQNSSYVIFASKHDDGTFWTENFNLGRFNTDGTDPKDEIGGSTNVFGAKTDKQKLREELASRYGVPFNFLPDARIVSAANVWMVPSAWKPATQITVSIGAPRPANTDLIIERQSGENPWAEIKRVALSATTAMQTEEIVVTFSGSPTDGMANVPKAGDSLRVRMANASRTSNYSTGFEMVASPEP